MKKNSIALFLLFASSVQKETRKPFRRRRIPQKFPLKLITNAAKSAGERGGGGGVPTVWLKDKVNLPRKPLWVRVGKNKWKKKYIFH
jgi:hypothetical protein